MELFWKSDNWRQILETNKFDFLYIKRCVEKKKLCVIARLQNSCLIAIAIFKNIEEATGGAEAVIRGILQKKALLKISRTSQENTCIVAFFNKVVGLQPVRFLKGDSNTSAFLRTLKNF